MMKATYRNYCTRPTIYTYTSQLANAYLTANKKGRKRYIYASHQAKATPRKSSSFVAMATLAGSKFDNNRTHRGRKKARVRRALIRRIESA